MANVFDTIPTGEGPSGNVFDTLPTAPKPRKKAPKRQRTTPAHDFVGGVADALTFGFADELGAGVRSLTGVNDRGSYKANLADLRDEAASAGNGRLAGQLLGAFAPIGGGAAALKAGTSLAKAAAKSGGAFGAAYGAGSADGDLEDRAKGAATGAALGAATGAVGAKVIEKAPRLIKAASPTYRFIQREKKNPLAAYRAEAAQDIKRVVTEATKEVGARSPKQLSANIAKRLNDLDDEYGAGMLEKLRAIPMDEGRRIALRDAWLARHSISKDKLDALRGDVGGDAVADAILKARAARSLSEEAKDGGIKALARLAIDASGATAGAGAGGPLGGFGGLAAARIIGRKLVGGEANRTVSAVRTAKNAKKFAALGKEVGPTGAAQSKERLDTLVAGIRNRKNAEAAARAAERQAAKAARARAAAENARLAQENAKIVAANRRDDIAPSGGFYGMIYERTGLTPAAQDTAALKMLANKVISPEQFDAFMKNPAKLMRGNGGNALIDRMARLADDGVLPRDPKWLERQAAAAAPEVAPAAAAPAEKFIANPLAYNATARANQARVSATLAQVQKADLDETAKTGIASAVTAIGNTSSKAEAKAIVDELLDGLPDAAKPYARQVLDPLLAQIKHQ